MSAFVFVGLAVSCEAQSVRDSPLVAAGSSAQQSRHAQQQLRPQQYREAAVPSEFSELDAMSTEELHRLLLDEDAYRCHPKQIPNARCFGPISDTACGIRRRSATKLCSIPLDGNSSLRILAQDESLSGLLCLDARHILHVCDNGGYSSTQARCNLFPTQESCAAACGAICQRRSAAAVAFGPCRSSGGKPCQGGRDCRVAKSDCHHQVCIPELSHHLPYVKGSAPSFRISSCCIGVSDLFQHPDPG